MLLVVCAALAAWVAVVLLCRTFLRRWRRPPSWKSSVKTPLRIYSAADYPQRDIPQEELTPPRFGADHVYVSGVGSVRELTGDEVAYIETRFHVFDGARPYIKQTYEEEAGDGWLNGFLLRSALPAGIPIGPPKEPWVRQRRRAGRGRTRR